MNVETRDGIGLLSVNAGLTEKQIGQLIEYANSDSLVGKFSSDPKRFTSRERYDHWLQKGRTIFSMTDQSGDLLGIIWYGSEAMPSDRPFTSEVDSSKYGVTFAIRIYGSARGQHLAEKLMRAVDATYRQSVDYSNIPNKGIWLETSENNTAAVVAYTKFGYKQVTNPDDHGKILMILPDSVTQVATQQ